MNTRDFAKKAIKDQIVRVSLRRFQVDGFENTTVDHISNDMGMSSRTFFRYFRSKDDVLLGSVLAFNLTFIETFKHHLSSKDIWAALEEALRETILNCEKSDPEHLGIEMQIMIRSTPVLFAKQLEITEHLVIEATDLYFSKFSDVNKLNWNTVNAIIRTSFACLHAIQCNSKASLADQIAQNELNTMMSNLKPIILSSIIEKNT